jgi:hypothetical protein
VLGSSRIDEQQPFMEIIKKNKRRIYLIIDDTDLMC